MMNKSIGIFDSGLGGLTVLKVLAKKFPHESFCYLGDIARLPYGNKSPETIKEYALSVLKFLKKQNVKALIIACNSASTVFLGETEFEGIPLLNVIDPGARAALSVSEDKKIGVLGTSATIGAHAYKNVLKSLDKNSFVLEKACPLFVPLVEEGLKGDPITQLVAHRYLSDLKKENVKTVILGCTHYPVLKDDLKMVLGDDVALIESGEVLSDQLQLLFRTKIISPSLSNNRNIRLYATDLTDHFDQLARELMKPEMMSAPEKVIL